MMLVLLLRKYEQPKQNAFQNHLNLIVGIILI